MDNSEIKKHLDKKVGEVLINQKDWQEKMSKSYDKLMRFVYVSLLLIAGALLGSGYINAKAVGCLETKTEILWKEYVPGDLLFVVMRSYDLQNAYTLSLLNGDKEGAEKKYKEFIEFRKEMYEKYFKTRGFVSPTEGRSAKLLTNN